MKEELTDLTDQMILDSGHAEINKLPEEVVKKVSKRFHKKQGLKFFEA